MEYLSGFRESRTNWKLKFSRKFSGNDSRQIRLFKEELGSDLMDVGGAHEGGPGPGRQTVGL